VRRKGRTLRESHHLRKRPTTPGISAKRNASQLARASGTVRGKSFIRMRIQLAGMGIPLDRGIELLRVEGLEPRAKPRQLARGKQRDGFLDVFGGGHVENRVSVREA